MMTLEQFREKAGGYPIDDLVRQIKNELHLQKVRIFFDNPYAQAMSRHSPDGTLEIHLPTLETIMQQKPGLTREEAIAKIKAATCEEFAHGVYHETNHDEKVVGTTIGCMNKHLSPNEMATQYIQEKIVRLRQASSVVGGMPFGVAGELPGEKMIQIFRSFDDVSARNAEEDLRKAGIAYRITRSVEGSSGQFPMVEFWVYPKDREAAHQIIDLAVNVYS